MGIKKKFPLVEGKPDADRCPKCYRLWNFSTNGYGVLEAVHPPIPCKPPVYQGGLGEYNPVEGEWGICRVCAEPFKLEPKRFLGRIVCSEPSCAKAHRSGIWQRSGKQRRAERAAAKLLRQSRSSKATVQRQ